MSNPSERQIHVVLTPVVYKAFEKMRARLTKETDGLKTVSKKKLAEQIIRDYFIMKGLMELEEKKNKK